MSANQDNRNEVWISRRKTDMLSGYIIEQTDVSLECKDATIDDLIKKAKDALG